MSLSVTLYKSESIRCPNCGHNHQIDTGEELFWANITHNLASMARAAAFYEPLWRPQEIGIKRAEELIEALEDGVTKLKTRPEVFDKYNAPNGWGTREQFIPWLEKYIQACKDFPTAIVSVSR